MPMQNPPHPGDLIRTEIIEPLGLTVSAAAEALGVRRATLSDLVNAKASLTPEMALRFEKAFGTKLDHLLRMQLAYDVARVRSRSDEIQVSRYTPGISSVVPAQAISPCSYKNGLSARLSCASSYKIHSCLDSRRRHQERAEHMQQCGDRGQAIALLHQIRHDLGRES